MGSAHKAEWRVREVLSKLPIELLRVGNAWVTPDRKRVKPIIHSGVGATQKALAHGVPVCAVPFGRDQ